jgi:hypothetical protein
MSATTGPNTKAAAMGRREAHVAAAERSALIAALIRGALAVHGDANRPMRLLFRHEETDPASECVVFLDYGISVGLPGSRSPSWEVFVDQPDEPDGHLCQKKRTNHPEALRAAQERQADGQGDADCHERERP